MSELSISRSSEFINYFRKMSVLIDGEKVDEIKSGETKVFSLKAGMHTVMAKLDGVKSNTIEHVFEEGKMVKVHLKSSKKLSQQTVKEYGDLWSLEIEE